MGTRADFYIGRGLTAEWIGSIALYGNPSGIPPSVLAATTEDTFRSEVYTFLKERGDKTMPSDGWPWPWNNSQLTDYSYALDGGHVHGSRFGHGWFNPQRHMWSKTQEDCNADKVEFPDMSALANNPPVGSLKSGIIVALPTPDRDLDRFTKASEA